MEKKKKKETELIASVLKKDPKTHKRLKECFLIGQNSTKRAHFRGSPLFQAMYNIKTEEEKKHQLIQLILCQLDVGGWQKEKGTRLTQSLVSCSK